jgi:hypothetical protein
MFDIQIQYEKNLLLGLAVQQEEVTKCHMKV